VPLAPAAQDAQVASKPKFGPTKIEVCLSNSLRVGLMSLQEAAKSIVLDLGDF
jgi:hypothetical protein